MSTLPTRSSAAEVENLLVIRRLALDGIESVSRADDLSIRKGLLLVDLAAESLLKAVLRRHSRPAKRDVRFDQLIELAITAHGKPLDIVAGFSPLRTMRNAVQHDGLPQDAVAARTAVEQAKEILAMSFRLVWNCEFEALGIGDFVADEHIRRLIRCASTELQAGEYFKSAALARAVVDASLARWTRFVQWLFKLREPPEDLLGQTLSALSSGAFLPSLARFRFLTERAVVSVTATFNLYFLDHGWGGLRTQDEKAAAAREALEFAGSLALQIDERLAGWTGERPHAEGLDPRLRWF